MCTWNGQEEILILAKQRNSNKSNYKDSFYTY
jgi:hypothetical protein